jgi:hypothetical protein
MTYKLVSSNQVVQRNLKIVFWGDTSTRKTEEVLRNFPDVCVIDAEGNVPMCIGNPKIPEFLIVPTKDPRDIIAVIDDITKGKLKFSDGRPVQTLCIDSWTQIWSVQQEVANTLAEKRAERFHKNGDEANATQGDWGIAKRPMAAIRNRMSNSPIKYLILICREKDLYDDKVKNQQVKIGFQADCVKGTMYESNLGLRFIKSPEGWSYVVTKVQGEVLGKIFPIDTTGTKIPYTKLFDFCAKIQTSVGVEKSEIEVAESQVTATEPRVKTYASLKEYATSLGIAPEKFGEALKSGGWTTYATSTHDAMEAYMEEWAAVNVATVEPPVA